jgi:hypothetical protein
VLGVSNFPLDAFYSFILELFRKFNILLNDDLDRYKECVDHVDNPIISNRRSMNKAVNAVSRKLPQMCFDTGLTVTNDRLCNDRDGNLTFCTNKGRRPILFLYLNTVIVTAGTFEP